MDRIESVDRSSTSSAFVSQSKTIAFLALQTEIGSYD